MHESAGEWQLRDLKGAGLASVQVGAVFVFVVSLLAGFALRGLFRGASGTSVSIERLTPIIIIIVSIAAIVVLHEAIHAVLFMLNGGRPRFGVKLIGRILPAVYATSTVRMPRGRYEVVCLSPFVLLTLILLSTGVFAASDNTAALALMLMALNAGGSVGDFVTARELRRYDRETVFQDSEDGFAWYRPESAR